MRRTFLAIVVLLGACDPSSITVSQAFAGETLPPVARFDNVRIESGIQDQMFPSLTDSTRIQELAGFIDARLDGWEVPWAGPPVGTVYLKLYLGDDFVGNFYVGPGFFGRDVGNFFSQSATTGEIAELGRIIDVPLAAILEGQ